MPDINCKTCKKLLNLNNPDADPQDYYKNCRSCRDAKKARRLAKQLERSLQLSNTEQVPTPRSTGSESSSDQWDNSSSDLDHPHQSYTIETYSRNTDGALHPVPINNSAILE